MRAIIIDRMQGTGAYNARDLFAILQALITSKNITEARFHYFLFCKTFDDINLIDKSKLDRFQKENLVARTYVVRDGKKIKILKRRDNTPSSLTMNLLILNRGKYSEIFSNIKLSEKK